MLGSRIRVVGFLSLVVLATAATVAVPARAQGPVSLCNSRLAVAVHPDSHLSFGAFPDTATCQPRSDGSSFSLSHLWPTTANSFTTVRIDQNVVRLSQVHELNPPTTEEVPGAIYAEYSVGVINITQIVEMSVNPITGRIDAARISYSLENNGEEPADVGLRWMLDANVANDPNAPYVIGGTRLAGEADFVSNIPDRFVIENTADPLKAGGGILTGGANVTPTRFLVSTASNLSSNAWFAAAGQTPMPFDTASATYWEQPQLLPGADVTFATQFGLGPADGSGGVGGGDGDGEPFAGCT
ncbi:MAG: hypothetical protein ACRDKT_08360, partial [Actinomycetota bacterium]